MYLEKYKTFFFFSETSEFRSCTAVGSLIAQWRDQTHVFNILSQQNRISSFAELNIWLQSLHF